MNKKQSKRQRDIKTKLMAAICMLLVSSIMMVSTTYAWFTLSTAPEVTGITTAVGANGNLEMALMPLDGNTQHIDSAVGDSIATTNNAYISNTTWGNLVDLSSAEYYGLDQITLYPAQLNVVEASNSIDSQYPLQTPEYGADGRVSELVKETLYGFYNGKNFDMNGVLLAAKDGSPIGSQGTIFAADATPLRGVRAIGVSSGMTDRQLAYRNLISAANGAKDMATKIASDSLKNNGKVLADMAVKHATQDNDDGAYGNNEVTAMKNVVNALKGEGTTKGALTYIEEALKQYIIAHNLATAADDKFEGLQTKLESMTLAEIVAATTVTDADNIEHTLAFPEGMIGTDGYVAKLLSAIDNVTQAQEKIDALPDLPYTDEDDVTHTGYDWDQVSPILNHLANPNTMVINDMGFNQLKEKDPVTNEYKYMSDLAAAVMADGLKIVMGTGSGVYADIADFCGDYSASVELDPISYGGITVPIKKATMSTKTEVSPVYLVQAKNGTKTFQDTVGADASKSLTDFYGYVIDLAFRTNVAGSDLLLQADAVNRIYSDSTNEDIMGGGATMSFTATTPAFDAFVTDLMDHIRIVFFDPSSGNKIIGYARLDTANSTQDANGKVTAELVMTDAAGVKKTTGEKDSEGNDILDYTIMELQQNTIHQLSVMVYLDGTTITNADVSNAVKSMVGALNLQFSSSATLTPMDYSDLKDGEADTTPTTFRLNNVNASALGVGVQMAAYDGKTGSVAIILDDTVVDDLQATVNGTTFDLTKGTYEYGGKQFEAYTFDASDVEGLEANTRIVLNVKGAATPETPAATTYDVTRPEGVTGEAKATANTAYSFTLTEGYTLTSITVGENTLTTEDYTVSDGTYTIKAEKVTGNITIAVTAPAAGG